MTLSGPKACLGSTKEVKILAAFLHSPVHMEVVRQPDMPRVIAGKRAEQMADTYCSAMTAAGYGYREASRRWYGRVKLRKDSREVKVRRGGC